MDTILANYVYTVFDKDGYRICKYRNIDSSEIFVASGNELPEYPRVALCLNGDWGENKHGKCFYVKTSSIHTEDTRESIVLYLSCGIFPYIGMGTAQKIYEAFGNNTLKILDDDIYKLNQIKGLSTRRVEKIANVYKGERNKKDLVNFLLPFGLSLNVILKVEDAYADMNYPEDIREKITVEPFRLINVRGITLDTISLMARKLGSDLKTYSAFRAFAINELMKAEVMGNTVMEISAFCNAIYKELKAFDYTTDDVMMYLRQTIKSEELVCITKEDGKRYVGRAKVCEREYETAKKLIAIKNNRSGLLKKDRVEKEIDMVCKEKNITLDDIQRQAVVTALTEKVSIITGGGGTGKTTISEVITEVNERIGTKPNFLLAPTARASRVLAEATDKFACTIHSGLQIGIEDDDKDGYESDMILENYFVLCDEGSMVDSYVCWQLMKHMDSSCSFLFIGDIDQLPSVGAGAVLRDIIESEAFPVTRLEKIYRQSEGSVIYENAQKIRKGITDIKDGDDFHFIECSSEEIEEKVRQKTLEMRTKYGQDNLMCLCPYKNKLKASVQQMNALLQEDINPQTGKIPSLERGNFEFRVGDVVMQTQKNRPECSNGDIGVITHIISSKEEKSITVSFPITNTTFCYEDDDIDELVLAYASTIHKAQGSQADAVVTCLADYHTFMLKRNFIYTAVSRAKKELWVFGNRTALEKAILTEDTYRRETSLKHFILMFSKKHEESKDEQKYEQMRLAI